MTSLSKKIIGAVLLFFIIFLVVKKPVEEKVGEKKKTDLQKICFQVTKEKNKLQYLKNVYEGYETFKLGGISSFSAQINKALEFANNTEIKPQNQKTTEELKDLADQCGSDLLVLNKDLRKLKPTFDYLEKIYPFYKDLKDSLQEIEKEKYQGFIDDARKIKEYQRRFEKDLNIFVETPPPSKFKETHLCLKKTLSGIIDFWTNAEVATVRKTPYIFNYALWVSQTDWQQLETTMAEELNPDTIGF